MALELSNRTFTNQADVVPPFGVEEILNTGIANTLAGNDMIIGTGSESRYTIFNSGTLNTGEGNDTITGIRKQKEQYPFMDYSAIYNERGTINTGNGNDRITGISEAGIGIQTLYGTINTGDGNDTITGVGFSHGIFINYGSTLDTGGGNDIITATGFRGLTHYSTINTSDGNDIITGTANGTSSGISGHGSIDTGNGNDIVTGISTTGYDGIISSGSLTLGDGNDLITGISTGSSLGVGIIVVSTTTIDTGNGDDIITGISTGYGIRNNGTINTGNGNDSIIADGGFEGSIGKSFLGDGKDYLKGFGSGKFYGGNDKDELELTSGSYTVGRSGTAVNFTKDSIIMNTSEFEILILGSKIYSFASLTAGQTIVVA